MFVKDGLPSASAPLKPEMKLLRHATPDDIPFIQSILNKPENWDKLEYYSNETLLASIADEGTLMLVWEDSGDLKGFCWLRQTNEGTKVEEFGVTSPGQGVGSRFFSAVLRYIQVQKNIESLWLAVAGDNFGAIRFYERQGFIETGIKRGVWERRRGPAADCVCMKLARQK